MMIALLAAAAVSCKHAMIRNGDRDGNVGFEVSRDGILEAIEFLEDEAPVAVGARVRPAPVASLPRRDESVLPLPETGRGKEEGKRRQPRPQLPS